jgi:hypothetical protein
MKFLSLFILLILASALASAQGPKPCEVLKAEIATKLDAHGAKNYTLNIVAKDQAAEGQVVGSCDGGTKKIMYVKAAPAPSKPAPSKN